ncbi:hypothetical protein GH733_007873 [Mirounga leonina]|nr:hypothetical protein GH733_007873 [Mirounga leonina]
MPYAKKKDEGILLAVTIFQNISKLRDIFYKEMNTLNHNSYEVMSKLEKQHSNSLVGPGTIKQQQILFGYLFLDEPGSNDMEAFSHLKSVKFSDSEQTVIEKSQNFEKAFSKAKQ